MLAADALLRDQASNSQVETQDYLFSLEDFLNDWLLSLK